MATRQFKALTEKGNHEVGALNSPHVKTLAHGAVATEEIDNFLLVETGFNAEGERTCSTLTDVTKKAYLIAAPEARYMEEQLVDYYNDEGERVRLVVLESMYTRFETSAFSLNTGVAEAAKGQVAHFDPATKKYILSNAASAHEDFASAAQTFLVVDEESDLEFTTGKATVRLEVQ